MGPCPWCESASGVQSTEGGERSSPPEGLMAEATKGLILGSTLLPFIKISCCGFKSSRGFELGQRFGVLPFFGSTRAVQKIADSPNRWITDHAAFNCTRGWNAP